MQIGQIQKIGIDGNRALLELRINPEVPIFAETCASPQMKGLLGEKFSSCASPRQGRRCPRARRSPASTRASTSARRSTR
ncbi:hypothetical protein [Nannocystis pusilla]|uniref:hypothetical protein n=1 Tax=Nannocystis pusilla TaxID=889268 RepID=UPI003B7D12C5